MKKSAIAEGLPKMNSGVCDENSTVHGLNFFSSRNFECDGILCDAMGIILEYLTPLRWKHLTPLNVIGDFERCGRCSQNSHTSERLAETLRSGVLARLTHLEVRIQPTLSCEDVIGWDTPNLEVLFLATGTDW
jgi:hypothetical protein